MDSDRMPLGNRPLTLCFNLLARVAAQTHPAALNSPALARSSCGYLDRNNYMATGNTIRYVNICDLKRVVAKMPPLRDRKSTRLNSSHRT